MSHNVPSPLTRTQTGERTHAYTDTSTSGGIMVRPLEEYAGPPLNFDTLCFVVSIIVPLGATAQGELWPPE
jgi:hypothetical protein